MNIEIRNRFNGSIIIVGEYENIKEAIQKNSGADLYGANLSGADLRSANLRSADLRSAKNIKLPIISLNGSKHSLFYINGIIQIGCEKCSEWVVTAQTHKMRLNK